MKRHRSARFFTITMILVLVMAVLAAPVAANSNTGKLRDAVTVNGILAHEQAFQAIANANGGTRASGTPGYQASVDYVADKLRGAGYDVTVQPFAFAFFQELSPAILQQVAPIPTTYETGTFTYSGSGNVTASVTAVDLLLPPTGGSTSGCEAADFAGFPAGNIALIQRGTCNFSVKAANAEAAGAAAVIIFNEGNLPERTELIVGTLGTPDFTIPVVGASFADGNELAGLIGSGLQMRVATSTISQERTTYNVLAETSKGDDSEVVMVGAHLDSVIEGPGINDNGSGSATILEVALQFARLNINPKNTVRFAFWGAEELNLLGSEFYVGELSEEELADIALYLNFDMVGSPNFVRFVYDGSEDELNPERSGFIENIFTDYFDRLGLATEPTPFDGRSDYGPFIAAGVPAGGLFTGAEGIKTAAQAAIYGGTAGVAFDPCYHQACDTIANLSNTALDQMSDATAHAVMYFATTKMPFKERGKSAAAPKNGHYKGPRAQR